MYYMNVILDRYKYDNFKAFITARIKESNGI